MAMMWAVTLLSRLRTQITQRRTIAAQGNDQISTSAHFLGRIIRIGLTYPKKAPGFQGCMITIEPLDLLRPETVGGQEHHRSGASSLLSLDQ
jgi:hypothetical protein